MDGHGQEENSKSFQKNREGSPVADLVDKHRRSVSSCKMFSLSEALVFGKAVIFLAGLRISIVRNSGAESGTIKNVMRTITKANCNVPSIFAFTRSPK